MKQSRIAAGLALAALAACGRAPAPEPEPELPDLRLQVHEGDSYHMLLREPGMERYAPANLGLGAADLARFEPAMAQAAPAPLVAGGGARALVFEGCRTEGCAEGAAVLAIDVRDGSVFVGVSDRDGPTVLLPNARLEALLVATSPTRRWTDPVSWVGAAPLPHPPAELMQE